MTSSPNTSLVLLWRIGDLVGVVWEDCAFSNPDLDFASRQMHQGDLAAESQLLISQRPRHATRRSRCSTLITSNMSTSLIDGDR